MAVPRTFRCAVLSAVKHDYVARGVAAHRRFELVVVADEMPDLPNRQLAHKLGLPKLQKWILANVFFAGPMSEVILQHTQLKIEPLVDQALRDWRIERIFVSTYDKANETEEVLKELLKG